MTSLKSCLAYDVTLVAMESPSDAAWIDVTSSTSSHIALSETLRCGTMEKWWLTSILHILQYFWMIVVVYCNLKLACATRTIISRFFMLTFQLFEIEIQRWRRFVKTYGTFPHYDTQCRLHCNAKFKSFSFVDLWVLPSDVAALYKLWSRMCRPKTVISSRNRSTTSTDIHKHTHAHTHTHTQATDLRTNNQSRIQNQINKLAQELKKKAEVN